MSNRRLESLDRFGEERSRGTSRRRSSTKKEKGSRRLSSTSSSDDTPAEQQPAWMQGVHVLGTENDETDHSKQAASQSQEQQDDDVLMEAQIAAFLEVMPDKSRQYAKKMLVRAEGNVQQSLLLAMEDPSQNDESSEHAPPPPRRSVTPPTNEQSDQENSQEVKAFLEVMPDGGKDYALKMLKRANNNVEQALCLAMEEPPPPPQERPASRRPSAQHQPSLTASDLNPSSHRSLGASLSDSTRFMAEFADEVPTFRPPSPLKMTDTTPPTSPGRGHYAPSQTIMLGKSSLKPQNNTINKMASTVRFVDDVSTGDRSIPNGATSNTDALEKMARVVTSTRQASLRDMSGEEAPVQRTTVHVGWNEDLFVMDGNDDGESSPSTTHSPSPPQFPDEPQRRQSLEERMHSSAPTLSFTEGAPGLLAPRRKNTLIVDKDKRNMRWQWTQDHVSDIFEPYRIMLSEQDDLLPDRDEFEAFKSSGAKADEDFENVRDCMLDDVELNEREVAAFFEGFALFNVKIRSLQSQLDSLKAVNRAAETRASMHKSFSALPTRSDYADGKFAQSVSAIPTFASRDDSSDDENGEVSPRMFGESLRALSIKKVQTEQNDNHEVQRLLKELEDADKKQKKLEKQLQQAGVIIAEDIPYEEAKSEVERIAKRMGEIGSSEVTHPDKAEQAKLREEYFRLEQDMEKYNAALMLTDEYIEEQEELEQKWEDDHVEENLEALKKLRRHMPVNVRSMSEAELSSKPSPNGKVLPKTIAKKFKRTNILQLIRIDPEELVRMHPSTLENLRVTGLTLTERRAIYAHIKDVGPRWKSMQADKMTERKWTWFKMMKQNFKENLDLYEYHVKQYGPPGNHLYASRDNPNEGCPMLGKQCPLKADKQIDYDGDYGYTDMAEYEVSNVRKSDKEDPGAKAKREAMELARDKKANERSVGLKKHYKGKVLQVSQANGSCEKMDEMLDHIEMIQTKWIEQRLSIDSRVITDDDKRKELTGFTEALNELKLGVLHLAERSGMQLTGKKDANADNPDKRSPIELGLCEEVYVSCVDFFDGISERMKEIKVKDKRLVSTIEQLQELLDELHDRNVATLKDLDCKKPAPSRKHKTYNEITKEVKAAGASGVRNDGATMDETAGPPPGAGDRGGLMAAIAGRGGRGGRGPPGGLMDAIKAGRGGRGSGPPGLMDAIKGRGGAAGRGPAGGRGGLLAAIEGRGRGGAGRGPPGLMDAIKGRGRGGSDSSTDQRGSSGRQGRGSSMGGRGDLMSAIAGRGKIE